MVTRIRVGAAAVLSLLTALTFLWFAVGPWPASARDAEQPWPAPEFTHSGANDWINTGPLSLKDLQGRVVLVDFWSFGCWNCYRSFPWLNELEARHEAQDLAVISVHSPEFDHERDRKRVAQKVIEFGLEHPVMMDNDFSYWKAMGNRYWPTFYVIDKAGNVRASYIGETHSGDANARAIEEMISELLTESLSS